MRLRLGCSLEFELPQPTPMIAMLNVHYSQIPFLEQPDILRAAPAVPLSNYRDGFGNWCTRFVAPAGAFRIGTDGVIRVDGAEDPRAPEAIQHPVEALPADTLPYLLGSRYCETDRLMDEAWQRFGSVLAGWARVDAICTYVHHHIQFDYMQARATRTAAEVNAEQVGVCRDFAHLAVAFCRCLNIPTRYCTGYVSDIGQPPPYPPMDFAAWIEVYLSGQWWTFDPRNLVPRRGRVLIAQGRDAADVPLTHSFGPNVLTGFEVWISEATD
ncbi:MAG: transglutaminase family protein [Pseudomonadota bacterium]